MDSTNFPHAPMDWAAQLSAARAPSTQTSSAELELDVFNLLNSDDPQLITQLKEQVFALEQKYKKSLDQGVAPSEYAQLNGLYQACLHARAILES